MDILKIWSSSLKLLRKISQLKLTAKMGLTILAIARIQIFPTALLLYSLTGDKSLLERAGRLLRTVAVDLHLPAHTDLCHQIITRTIYRCSLLHQLPCTFALSFKRTNSVACAAARSLATAGRALTEIYAEIMRQQIYTSHLLQFISQPGKLGCKLTS